MIIIFLVFLGLLILARFLYKFWWYPLSIQHLMNSQGIKGPTYKFPNGNAREIGAMIMESNTAPMELSSHDIFPRLQPQYNSWIKLYGRNFLCWNNTQPQLVVTDVDLIKEILSNKEGSFGKSKIQGIIKKFIGEGSAFQDGQKWSKLRKVADHVFHVQSLKDMFPAMIESVEAMLERWKSYEGKEIEVFEEFRLLSSEIIAKSVFGGNFSDGQHIFNLFDKLALICTISFGKSRNPIIEKMSRSSEEIESDKVLKDLYDLFDKMIKKREEKQKTGQSDNYGNDFLGSLLKAHHNPDKEARITVDEIIQECKLFYFGGHKTITSLLSWSILLLAIHTDSQEKARNEILQTFGQDNPTTESISRLKIVGMIMNEALRLYPPVIAIPRKVTRKTRLGELTIPAGIELIVPALQVHHSSEVWGEDAQIFKPERFAKGMPKATRDELMVFLSFGFGLRKCVGVNFVQMEVKSAVSMILQRYKLTVSPNYSHFPMASFALDPKHGIQIMLHPLKNY